jgi:hypothetical protein
MKIRLSCYACHQSLEPCEDGSIAERRDIIEEKNQIIKSLRDDLDFVHKAFNKETTFFKIANAEKLELEKDYKIAKDRITELNEQVLKLKSDLIPKITGYNFVNSENKKLKDLIIELMLEKHNVE